MASNGSGEVGMGSPSQSCSSSFESMSSMSPDKNASLDTPPQTPPSSHLKEHAFSSSTVSLTSFHYFPQLPFNVRSQIWSLAAPEPRTRFVELHGYNSIDFTPNIRYIPPLPNLFHVCHEARAAALADQGGELVHFTGNTSLILLKANFYFNFNTDILFLSSRFTAVGNSTETYRLRELGSILPPGHLSRIRRLVVTYSGLDSYERIGPLLRPYARLEVLYVSMMDWWSNRTMKRQLRKGNPVAGVVAEKIQKVVDEVEAEETDDDEESDEHVVKRLAARAQRRIVEVELRLDE